MNTATAPKTESQSPVETVEAVIISGPRKGEIATFSNNGELQLSAEEEAMLDFVVKAAKQMAESACAASEAARALRHELHEVVSKAHGGNGQAV